MNDYLAKMANTGNIPQQLLDECRELMTNRLSQSLSEMMDKVDDVLFDLSNKTSDINAHSQYFYAMRELRLNRTDIESGFRENLKGLF